MHSAELIPEGVHQFAREFTALARKHGLRSGAIQLSFTYDRKLWDQPITIVWEQGRHGEDARNYRIETTLRVSAKVEDIALTTQGGGDGR